MNLSNYYYHKISFQRQYISTVFYINKFQQQTNIPKSNQIISHTMLKLPDRIYIQ